MRTLIARLTRMDRREVAWRAVAAARALRDRVRTRVVPPTSNRLGLPAVLARKPELGAVRDALSAREWTAAHRRLVDHLTGSPVRFVVHTSIKPAIVDRIRAEFPQATADASARADRIVRGEYDLLGYGGPRFDSPAGVRHRSPSASGAIAAVPPRPFPP